MKITFGLATANSSENQTLIASQADSLAEFIQLLAQEDRLDKRIDQDFEIENKFDIDAVLSQVTLPSNRF